MAPKSSTESDLDELHRGPLTDFVRQRNTLAMTLRDQGLRNEAARVKALAKPSATAWAVNAVYWHARPVYDRVVDAGARMRAIQQRGLGSAASGEEVRHAGRHRRDALERAVERAAGFLTEAGHAATPALLRRVERTFEAVAAGAAAEGRLVADLEPPGFETLLQAAVPGAATRSPTTAPPQTPADPPASETALAERKDALAAARREARRTVAVRTRAETNVQAAATRLARTEEAVTRVRERLEAAKRDVVAARGALVEAERSARSALVEAESAARAVTTAQGALEALGPDKKR